MKQIIGIVFISSLLFTACSKDEEKPLSPTACFTIDTLESINPADTFFFSNCSQNYSRAEWNFGDGNTSTAFGTEHIYNQYGNFTITLTVFNSEGESSTTSQSVVVGHFSLERIVYFQTVATPPVLLSFTQYPFFDTVASTSALPFTHFLPDNSVYDVTDTNAFYHYVEDSGFNDYFQITPSLFQNRLYAVALPNATDTARFMMYFWIAPR